MAGWSGTVLMVLGLAGLAIWQASQRVRTRLWLPLLFGVLFVLAFLVWAGADRGAVIPLVTMLTGALALSVPLIFGAMCGLVGERSGVINIAIEAQLLAGAFLAAVAASVFTSAYMGLVFAPVAGALVAGGRRPVGGYW